MPLFFFCSSKLIHPDHSSYSLLCIENMKNEWSLPVKNLAPWCPSCKLIWETEKTWYGLKEKESQVTTNKQTRQIPMMPGHCPRGRREEEALQGIPSRDWFPMWCHMSLGVRPGCYLPTTPVKLQLPPKQVTNEESFWTLGTIGTVWAILRKTPKELLTCSEWTRWNDFFFLMWNLI